MNSGRKNSKPNIGIHGHAGGTSPGQTRKTPKNLSAHESEERGREESVGLYATTDRFGTGSSTSRCQSGCMLLLTALAPPRELTRHVLRWHLVSSKLGTMQ